MRVVPSSGDRIRPSVGTTGEPPFRHSCERSNPGISRVCDDKSPCVPLYKRGREEGHSPVAPTAAPPLPPAL